MKKKYIVLLSIFTLFILLGAFIYFNYDNEKTIVTLDINPSIEMTLGRGEIVKKIVSLNEEAKEVINDEMIGKSFKESFNLLTEKLINHNYIERDRDSILISSKGKISAEEIVGTIKEVFEENNVNPNIIIPVITESATKLAEELGISEAKAAYIEDIVKNIEEIDAKSLVNKSVDELNYTKESGKYCDADYTLEGDFCVKVISEERAISGSVCPESYYEYKGKCYKETFAIESDNLKCNEPFNLVDGKCVREITQNAVPTNYLCTSGTLMTRAEAGLTLSTDGDANDKICVDATKATHPMSPCEVNDGTEYTISGGKCYWHRAPVIADGCPGKIQIDGFCWDDASNILICVGARDGKRYNSRSEYCEGSVKYYNPSASEYKCVDNDAKLSGTKCIIEEIEDAQRERVCPNGYTMLEEDKCINYNEIAEKTEGFKCEEENTRLNGTKCEILEIIDAKEY